MSQDEGLVTFIALVVGPSLWMIRLERCSRIRRSAPAVAVLGGTLAICAAMLLGVLSTLAAADVVHAPPYVFMYFMTGLAWIGLAEKGFAFAGVSLRDDGVERRNGAA